MDDKLDFLNKKEEADIFERCIPGSKKRGDLTET
jgi:hypothetical protein